jgi:hypothetical protein
MAKIYQLAFFTPGKFPSRAFSLNWNLTFVSSLFKTREEGD